jgi:hypothetical protein
MKEGGWYYVGWEYHFRFSMCIPVLFPTIWWDHSPGWDLGQDSIKNNITKTICISADGIIKRWRNKGMCSVVLHVGFLRHQAQLNRCQEGQEARGKRDISHHLSPLSRGILSHVPLSRTEYNSRSQYAYWDWAVLILHLTESNRCFFLTHHLVLLLVLTARSWAWELTLSHSQVILPLGKSWRVLDPVKCSMHIRILECICRQFGYLNWHISTV